VWPRCSWRKAYRIGFEQHAVLPGPNSGWSEAATAIDSMKKYFGFIICFFLAAFVNSSSFADTPIEEHEHTAHHHDEAQEPALSGRIDENGARIIEVKASRYKFDPDPIVVKLGEKVRFEITSADVTHGLAIADFQVNISVLAGETKTAEFVADKKGSFHMHCSVYCGPGHSHMHGTLIVQ